MKIWHQSFTVLDDVPHYRDALATHVQACASPSTEVHLHGMAPGTYPSDYPGTHIAYRYLSRLHGEQFITAAIRAQDEGYDAFLIATIPDTGYEDIRTLIDIPVVAFGQTSVLVAATLGDRVGVVNFIGDLVPQLRHNFRGYGLDGIVGPIVQIEEGFQDVLHAYSDPAPLLAAFTTAARTAIRDGANVIVPGEGPLNVFLARHGITRVDDVPVIDSLGTCVVFAELRVNLHRRSGLVPARVGFNHAQPPPDAVAATRAWYGVDRATARAATTP